MTGFLGRSCPVADLALLAVDLETTGLDPGTDEILSIGLVPVDGLQVDLSGARSLAVRPRAGVGDSAAVHGLTDAALADGLPLAQALPVLLAALHGRVLLAHHAPIEVGFLRAACRSTYGAAPRPAVVDTVALHRRVLRRSRPAGQVAARELRLDAARHLVGLPRYRAHDALSDALACAELYLAQIAHLGVGTLRLRRLPR